MELVNKLFGVFMLTVSNPLTWIVLAGLVVMVLRKVYADRAEAARIAALPKVPYLKGIKDKKGAQAAWVLYMGWLAYGEQLNAACLKALQQIAKAHGADDQCVLEAIPWLLKQGYVKISGDTTSVTELFRTQFAHPVILYPPPK